MTPDASSLKAGQILLYDSPSIVDWLITRTGPAAHIEFYEGNGKSLASRNGLGVARYDLRMDGLIAVLELNTGLNSLSGMVEQFSKWFETVDGENYDWFGLEGFLKGETTNEPNHLFCSAFVAQGLWRIGYPVFNKLWPCSLITPSDFLKTNSLKWEWAATDKMWL